MCSTGKTGRCSSRVSLLGAWGFGPALPFFATAREKNKAKKACSARVMLGIGHQTPFKYASAGMQVAINYTHRNKSCDHVGSSCWDTRKSTDISKKSTDIIFGCS